MSVEITIANAVKKYGDNTIIGDLSLTIREGEFFTLLGPSGCGKTTLLRMIAGFNSIEGGEFFFNEKLINDIDPSRRNIGMVFQNYAIFPHLTVEQNVAFGLKNRKCDKETITRETEKFLRLMQIEEYRNRLPERLSGGQQQRVALARALVISPDVLLMDEPLSNLDAKLRVEMRSVIKDVQNSLGITTVYVTHDQEEAMAISDRIAVMNKGEIQQIGTPKALYQRPKNLFVATFIGHTNILKGTLSGGQGKQILALPDGYSVELGNVREKTEAPRDVLISVRPEEFTISEKSGEPGIQGTVDSSIFLGLNTHYRVKLSSGEKIEIIQESTIDSIIPTGTDIVLQVKKEKINVLSEDGGSNLLEGVQDDTAEA
ncbi:ABC transporter ATP-binding protein [Breznakiella homolactica]|uniref:ABC transporter ATP-binding protein n=1 Tax=Breznakiella homolactica TaxID=2798577 RepID=A0A7T7XN74_9SPIR|nr:ABC transporter ATP-binding protein [Breznakiella homolactica]QQO09450.1 ABC transporter ATP-binding protein [Breznakiella homolactica]